jgi:iron complex transport system ATP-binding protein
MEGVKPPVRLEAADVGAGYDGTPVLRNVSARFAAGAIAALIGPNGAGKSTLLRCLSGALAPQSGHIRLDGRELASIPGAERAQRIAFVPSTLATLFPSTVAELVALGRVPYRRSWEPLRAADRAAIDRALAEADLADVRDHDYDALSAGQRQRALLGMALAQEAGTILLDEPTAHLDVRHAWSLLETLRAACDRGGLCIVFATHDLNLAAAFADQLVLLHHGALVAAGPAGAVLSEDLLGEVYGHPLLVHYGSGQLVITPRRTPR